MKSILQIRTSGGNDYMYNKNEYILQYVHPLIRQFLLIEKRGFDIENLSKEFIADELQGWNEGDLSYYRKKFRYMKSAGLLDLSAEFVNNYDGRVDPEMIRSQLANARQIIFEVTDKCNMKCYYCGYGALYGHYDKREGIDLDLDKAKVLIDYLSEIWKSSYHISHNKTIHISFYGGEPLLSINTIQSIIDYLEKKNLSHIHFVYNMTTNAVLLNKHIEFLIKHDFRVLISLDGDGANNGYRKFKNNKDSYEVVHKNIKFVQKNYPDFFENNVNINSVLHNRNSVSQIYHVIQSDFGKMPSIGELNLMGVRSDKKKEFLRAYQNTNESLHQSEDYTKIENEMLVSLPGTKNLLYFIGSHSNNVFNEYSDFFIKKKQYKNIPTGTCIAFSRKLFLTASGKILPCERISHEYGVGEIVDGEVKMDIEKMAEKYNEYYDKLTRQCKECYRLDRCFQCMFYIDNLKSKPRCDGFIGKKMMEDDFGLHISTLESTPAMYKKLMEDVVIY